MPYKDPEYQRTWQREWMARRRAEWFAGKACAHCGSIEDLQLDHIDAKDKVAHSVWSWSQVRREAELAKCQVLCEPCHKAKTKENGEHARGEKNGQHKLTAHEVTAIRQRAQAGEMITAIAKDYPQVTKWALYKITEGNDWKYLGL